MTNPNPTREAALAALRAKPRRTRALRYFALTIDGRTFLRSSPTRTYVCATVYAPHAHRIAWHISPAHAGKLEAYTKALGRITPVREVSRQEYLALRAHNHVLEEA